VLFSFLSPWLLLSPVLSLSLGLFLLCVRSFSLCVSLSYSLSCSLSLSLSLYLTSFILSFSLALALSGFYTLVLALLSLFLYRAFSRFHALSRPLFHFENASVSLYHSLSLYLFFFSLVHTHSHSHTNSIPFSLSLSHSLFLSRSLSHFCFLPQSCSLSLSLFSHVPRTIITRITYTSHRRRRQKVLWHVVSRCW